MKVKRDSFIKDINRNWSDKKMDAGLAGALIILVASIALFWFLQGDDMTREELKLILQDAYEYSGCFETIAGDTGAKLVDFCIDEIIKNYKIYDDFETMQDDNTALLAYQKGIEDTKKDFESRTCENCKHGDIENTLVYCLNGTKQCVSGTNNFDFGCNRWEAK